MKNLTKNSVANVAKVGVASALIGAGLFLSACGGDSTSKAEKFVKEKYPDAKILNFSEIEKEFGLKDKECLTVKDDYLDTTYHFVRMADEKLVILTVQTRHKDGMQKFSGGSGYTIGEFKHLKPNCF